MGQKFKAQRISKKSEAKEEDAKMARFQDVSDSESGYSSVCSEPLATVTISKTTVPQWYLDTCASTHISDRKDQFIRELKPSSAKISVAKSNCIERYATTYIMD
jgi:hypothetical protein